MAIIYSKKREHRVWCQVPNVNLGDFLKKIAFFASGVNLQPSNLQIANLEIWCNILGQVKFFQEKYSLI